MDARSSEENPIIRTFKEFIPQEVDENDVELSHLSRLLYQPGADPIKVEEAANAYLKAHRIKRKVLVTAPYQDVGEDIIKKLAKDQDIEIEFTLAVWDSKVDLKSFVKSENFNNYDVVICGVIGGDRNIIADKDHDDHFGFFLQNEALKDKAIYEVWGSPYITIDKSNPHKFFTEGAILPIADFVLNKRIPHFIEGIKIDEYPQGDKVTFSELKKEDQEKIHEKVEKVMFEYNDKKMANDEEHQRRLISSMLRVENGPTLSEKIKYALRDQPKKIEPTKNPHITYLDIIKRNAELANDQSKQKLNDAPKKDANPPPETPAIKNNLESSQELKKSSKLKNLKNAVKQKFVNWQQSKKSNKKFSMKNILSAFKHLKPFTDLPGKTKTTSKYELYEEAPKKENKVNSVGNNKFLNEVKLEIANTEAIENATKKIDNDKSTLFNHPNVSSSVRSYFSAEVFINYVAQLDRDIKKIESNAEVNVRIQDPITALRAMYVLPECLMIACQNQPVNSDYCERLNSELQVQELAIFEMEQQFPEAAIKLRNLANTLRQDPKFYEEIKDCNFGAQSVSKAFNDELFNLKNNIQLPQASVEAKFVLLPASPTLVVEKSNVENLNSTRMMR